MGGAVRTKGDQQFGTISLETHCRVETIGRLANAQRLVRATVNGVKAHRLLRLGEVSSYLTPSRRDRIGSVLMALAGVGLVDSGVFVADGGNRAVSFHGNMHMTFTLVFPPAPHPRLCLRYALFGASPIAALLPW